MIVRLRFLCVLCCSIMFFQTIIYSQSEKDYVDSKMYEFIGDGAWCWFQDERAVVDTKKEKLVIGSANTKSGVDLIIFDIKEKKVESKKGFGGLEYTDDHNSPGLLVAPNGNYLALWNHHYDKHNTRYSIYDGQKWSSEKRFDWNKIPGGTNYTICYSNIYYLSSEDRIYNFARANERAPNFIYSDDNGETWSFGGQITTNSSSSYNKGYYKYWGDGVERIDIVFTEQHPRDHTTSIYHGYIQDGKTYNSEGVEADNDIYDRGYIPTFDKFTKVFAHNTRVNGVTMGRCWQHDIVRYDDGVVAILFKARADNSEYDHRNFYARYDGDEWKITYIGKAGTKMYDSEQDYTGLGALCPDDPDRIYISSPYNPGDDNSKAGKREIWRGTTTDNGETWSWEPVTANSSVDNFRPIVPKWEPGKEALLWWRGTYQTAQIFSTSVVGTFYEYDAGAGYRISVETSGRGTVSKDPDMRSYPKDTTVVLTATPRSGWSFAGWSGDKESSENPLTVTVDTNISITAEFERTGVDTTELVIDGQFESESELWVLNIYGGSATGSVVDGEYKMDISSSGSNDYDVQLAQAGIYLENGRTYRLRFDAYAESSRNMGIKVGQADEPYNNYLNEPAEVSLTTVSDSFSIEFEMTEPTDENARIEFNAGSQLGDVFIDNVSLREISTTSVIPLVDKGKYSRPRITSSGIKFDNGWSGNVDVKLYDLSGKLVYGNLFVSAPGKNSMRFDTGKLAKGLYVVKIYSGKNVLHSEMVHLR